MRIAKFYISEAKNLIIIEDETHLYVHLHTGRKAANLGYESFMLRKAAAPRSEWADIIIDDRGTVADMIQKCLKEAEK